MCMVQLLTAGMASVINGFSLEWTIVMFCHFFPSESLTALLLYLAHFIITFSFPLLFVECSWDQRTQKVRPLWPLYQCQGVYLLPRFHYIIIPSNIFVLSDALSSWLVMFSCGMGGCCLECNLWNSCLNTYFEEEPLLNSTFYVLVYSSIGLT